MTFSSSSDIMFVKFSAAYNYPNPVNQYGADGRPCCPANTFCTGAWLSHFSQVDSSFVQKYFITTKRLSWIANTSIGEEGERGRGKSGACAKCVLGLLRLETGMDAFERKLPNAQTALELPVTLEWSIIALESVRLRISRDGAILVSSVPSFRFTKE